MGGTVVGACGRERGPDWAVGALSRGLKLPRPFWPICERSNRGTFWGLAERLLGAPPQGSMRNFAECTQVSGSGVASVMHSKSDQNQFSRLLLRTEPSASPHGT